MITKHWLLKEFFKFIWHKWLWLVDNYKLELISDNSVTGQKVFDRTARYSKADYSNATITLTDLRWPYPLYNSIVVDLRFTHYLIMWNCTLWSRAIVPVFTKLIFFKENYWIPAPVIIESEKCTNILLQCHETNHPYMLIVYQYCYCQHCYAVLTKYGLYHEVVSIFNIIASPKLLLKRT